MAAPILFRSTDSGAPVLTGQVGALLGVLDACLIINKLFTAVSGASFVDNTVEAQQNPVGETGFKLFQGPTVTVDEAYFGMTARFDRIRFKFSTAGVQATAVTLAWEYWTGSAWAALAGVVDGTAGLTADGTVTWTIPTSATTAINSVTQYWVRCRFTAGTWTTNPLVSYCTVTGWHRPFATASNISAYQMGGGNQLYLSVNDNAPVHARNARVQGFETMSALQTGTGPFPLVEAATMTFRKSTTLDATARVWMVLADDRTFYLFNQSGDGTALWKLHFFGDFYSLIPNDAFRVILAGCGDEPTGLSVNLNYAALTSQLSATGQYLCRGFSGVGGATICCKNPNYGLLGVNAANPMQQAVTSALLFPNPADGGFWVSSLLLSEGAVASSTFVVRGRMRGLWASPHSVTNFTDGDTVAGSDAYAGRNFMVVKFTGDNSGNILNGIIIETSDTWDTN